MNNQVTFENEMFYSIRDIVKKTNLTHNEIEDRIKQHGLKGQVMLKKIRVYKGNDLQPLFNERKVQYTLLSDATLYPKTLAYKTVGVSADTFDTQYIQVHELKPFKMINKIAYYLGEDINKISDAIDKQKYPIQDITLEDREYPKTELFKALHMSSAYFTKVYETTYGLNPIHTMNGDSKGNTTGRRIMYNGRDVNEITRQILAPYKRG